MSSSRLAIVGAACAVCGRADCTCDLDRMPAPSAAERVRRAEADAALAGREAVQEAIDMMVHLAGLIDEIRALASVPVGVRETLARLEPQLTGAALNAQALLGRRD